MWWYRTKEDSDVQLTLDVGVGIDHVIVNSILHWDTLVHGALKFVYYQV